MGFLSIVMKVFPIALGIIKSSEELFGPNKGQEKKEAYINILMNALGITESIIDKDIINDQKFKSLMGRFADLTIEINNFIRDFKSKGVK